MRIAVDARVLCLPELRGIGSYLCELLAAWPSPQDTFVLMAPSPIPQDRLRGSTRIETVPVSEPRGCRLRVYDWWSLPRAMAKAVPDLVWGPANLAIPAVGLPQAVTIHDTLLQERVRFTSGLDALFHRRVNPAWVRRHADRVITVSRFAASRIQAVFGCEPSRLRVIGNGASRPRGRFADKERARAHLRAAGLTNRDYVLALGAHSPWKNTEGALRAFALAAKSATEVEFVLAGVQDEARPRFASLARELGLNGRVRILGFVDPVSRDALYQGARVFVYPSLFEGFGLPPLEAMALATPVVASRAAAIPEVTGQAALLCDASDPDELSRSILRVLSSPKLAQLLAAAGLDNVARFRWEDAAAAHRRVFEECLQA